jgi:hypothetical protein
VIGSPAETDKIESRSTNARQKGYQIILVGGNQVIGPPAETRERIVKIAIKMGSCRANTSE